MATDAIGQTIPSWVEDNSYELKSVGTFTSNEGHITPCSDADFRALWKTHYNNHIVRDGKYKDNSAYDGKFFVDSQRNYNKVEDLPEQLNVTGSNNSDGKPMGIIPALGGEDETDTANYGASMWIGNSGLDAYSLPTTFWIGDTEVTKDDAFTSVKKSIIWRYASDYKKAMCNEVNPEATVAKRTRAKISEGPLATTDEQYAATKFQGTTGEYPAPTEEERHLQQDTAGETYTTKLTCMNDFLVSGAGMKYKIEWEKNENTAIASEVDTWLIANGYGRSSKQDNVWVTHTPQVIGQARLLKECYNFVGGARVETTLQDIDSGVFGLPAGHPIIAQHTSNQDLEGGIDMKQHFPDEAGFNDGTQVIPDSIQAEFGKNIS